MNRILQFFGVLCALNLLIGIPGYAEEKTRLHTVVVTATRESKPQNEVPASITVTDTHDIQHIAPAHPADIFNRTAGVHINTLAGEGHMTAIRQPITTAGVYLFLEDGLPTRPTGLFNHNALYEINIPQAARIEVIKGPGAALYGSDSIGGIINAITASSPKHPEISINPEYGSYGWQRVLASGGMAINPDLGFRIDMNITDHAGYRDESEYRRYATTLRIDGFTGDNTTVKTILSYNQVNQSGVSSLEEEDFRHHTTKNRYHHDVGRRDVNALRISTAFTHEPSHVRRFTLTPFYRYNQMTLMPSWMLGYDPNDRDYQFASYGVLGTYRHQLPNANMWWMSGIDVDYTPSNYQERHLMISKQDDIITHTTPTGRINYQFDANQLSLSPYVHTEWQVLDALRITGGFRYDYFHVDYTDHLDPSVSEIGNGKPHLRPDSESLSYDHLSPKTGLIYDITPHHHVYANYRHSFRVPAIGQLFRSGGSSQTTALTPIKTNSMEIGSRGFWFGWLSTQVAVYHMQVTDDIVSYIDPISEDRKLTNAGQTTHRGIEIESQGRISESWSFRTAQSLNHQKYDDFTAVFGFPSTQTNYAGNRVARAPQILGNLAVQYRPTYLPGTQIEWEWEQVGSYHTDETNTQQYGGHHLFNLRANYQLNQTISLYGRIMNLTNTRYATYASNQVGSDNISYQPGLPRRVYFGIRVQF
jgi:outer membrane receptor protein involved in Fe transport